MKFNRLLKILLLFAWLGMPLLSRGDDQAKALFDQANSFYSKSQYKEALNAYNKLVNDGYPSATVYFNMGNASYKMGDIPSAILYYEKAHRLSPGDEDINFNLKYVNLKTTDKIEETPEFFLTRWWKGIVLNFSLNILSVWSILLVLAGSVALIFYFFAEAITLKKASFYIAIPLFLAGVFFIFIAGSQVSYFDDHRQAIIFNGSVNVKNGPMERSSTSFVIHDGTKVNILDTNNGWLKIRLANGNEGWIQASGIKEI